MTDPIDRLAMTLRSTGRVAWLTGAGLSVASGIAPYRRAPDAVWDRFVTDWGTVERFLEDPGAWWREFWLRAHGPASVRREPNAGHRAITALLEGRPGHVVITQNIDGLHRRAGVPGDRLIEVHGAIGKYRCLQRRCRLVDEELPLQPDVELLADPARDVPRCPACGGPAMPLVLLFDEAYAVHPFFQFARAARLLDEAEAVVFVGTSFSVGITEVALDAARASGAALFNVNLAAEDGMDNLAGPAEVTLPEVARRVLAPP